MAATRTGVVQSPYREMGYEAFKAAVKGRVRARHCWCGHGGNDRDLQGRARLGKRRNQHRA